MGDGRREEKGLPQKVIMLRNVPDQVHRDFKLLCVKRGVSMRDRLQQLIEEDVRRNQRELVRGQTRNGDRRP